MNSFDKDAYAERKARMEKKVEIWSDVQVLEFLNACSDTVVIALWNRKADLTNNGLPESVLIWPHGARGHAQRIPKRLLWDVIRSRGLTPWRPDEHQLGEPEGTR